MPAEPALRTQLRLQLGIADVGTSSPEAGKDTAVDRVSQHVGGGDTGEAFDLHGRNEQNDITSDGLIAVTMLSIKVSEHSDASTSHRRSSR